MDFLAKAETFVRIVESGSFSAAGRSLKLSLAAISRQVAALEGDLDAKLLVRTTRSLHLTDEGKRFHDHAQRLLREADAARASVRPEGSAAGKVVVSASVSLALLRIVPTLPSLFAQYPRLDVAMRLEDRSADLVAEGVDIAVRAGLELPDTTNLIAQHLATFQRVLVAAPSYLRREGTPRSLAALAEHRAVLGLESSGDWHFRQGGEERTVTVRARLRIGTLLGVRDAVSAGLGIAVLPDFIVRDGLSTRSLKALLPEAELQPVSAHALYRVESRGNSRVEAVLHHLRGQIPLSATPRKQTPRVKK